MGSRVRLGIMPAYGAEIERGVLIDDVFEGTSAAEAGILGGDIIVGWNHNPIDDGADLMENLRRHAPGDLVRVRIIRNGEEVTLDITLKAREEGS